MPELPATLPLVTPYVALPLFGWQNADEHSASHFCHTPDPHHEDDFLSVVFRSVNTQGPTESGKLLGSKKSR